MIIKNNFKVLFQGDSITDCGRSYENNDLGQGYAMMAAAWFNAMYPELDVEFLNRGISGNRTIDLKERWQTDCIDIKPDVVSIMIGINDCWRKFDNDEETSVEEYKSNYRWLLKEIRDKLDTQIIICEPFLLPVTEDQKKYWREDLDPKIHAARELSREFNTLYIPYDGIFAAKTTRVSPSFWASDGVHPTQAGHALMAKSWLEAVGAF